MIKTGLGHRPVIRTAEEAEAGEDGEDKGDLGKLISTCLVGC